MLDNTMQKHRSQHFRYQSRLICWTTVIKSLVKCKN